MLNSTLITVSDPKSHVAEAYRILRTNVLFSSVDKRIGSIVITSAGPAEGKSTVASNFAITLAHADSKVLVIDCDLRKPTIHKKFGISNRTGLTNVIAQNLGYDKVVQGVPQIPNLSIITSGPIPPNPSELIGSEKMKRLISLLSDMYDYIILDTPPVGMVTDAALLASYTDGVIIVMESGNVEIEEAQRTKVALNNVKAHILGVVMNKIAVKNSGYYYKYYYSEDRDEGFNEKKKRRIGKKHNDKKGKVVAYD